MKYGLFGLTDLKNGNIFWFCDPSWEIGGFQSLTIGENKWRKCKQSGGGNRKEMRNHYYMISFGFSTSCLTFGIMITDIKIAFQGSYLSKITIECIFKKKIPIDWVNFFKVLTLGFWEFKKLMRDTQRGWVIMFLFGSGKEMNFGEFLGLFEVQDWYFLLELRRKG